MHLLNSLVRKSLLFLFFLLLLCCQKQHTEPQGLRTDLMRNADYVGQNGFKQHIPLNDIVIANSQFEIAKVQSENPLFHWVLDPQSKTSVAYQILVSGDLNTLEKNQGDLWDSGKIKSPLFSSLYLGSPLRQNKVYYWKVRYWENEKQYSNYSNPQSFVIDKDTSQDRFSQEPLRAENQKAAIYKKTKGYFIDFKKAAFGKLRIQLNASKEDTITLSVGELKEQKELAVQNPGGNIRYFKTTLYLKPGLHWYEIEWPEDKKRARNPFMIPMPDYISQVFPFRYVELNNYHEVLKENQVIRTMIHYNFKEEASYFRSSDPVLNQVWELCKYSMKATSFLGYYVDGDRERIPYEADAFINQLSHYAVDAEYGLSRGSMKHLLFNPTWPTEWTLYNILMAWYDFLYTGDDRFILKYYDELKIKTLMDLADNSGLISTRTGKQTEAFFKRLHKKHWGKNNKLRDIVDWPQAIPPGGYTNLEYYIGDEKEYPGENDGYVYQTYNAVVNALYYGALNYMKNMAQYLGKTEDKTLFERQAKIVKKQFLSTFQDPISGLINDGEETNHQSQHANMFALTFGLIPQKDKAAVLDYIKSKNMSCSVYAAQILLEGLFDNGGADQGIALMAATTERSWYNMIRFGSTVTMEAWDKRYKPNLDLNHAWGGAPANIIVRKMMGVEPLTPGAQKIKIHPKIGTLSHAELKTSLISGPIELKCNQTETSYKLEVNIAGGVKADIIIPAEKGTKQLFINGSPSDYNPKNGVFHLADFPSGISVLEVK